MFTHKKILLVDDDPDDQELFSYYLKEIEPGVECAIAGNGYEALDYLFQTVPPPSLILLDINMPVMNGLECLNELKRIEEFKNIPVIMLTTSSDPPSINRALKMGARLFLTKAADIAGIRLQLRQVLEKDFVTHF